MDWRIKASLQKILSLSRIGDRLNHIPATHHKNYHHNVVTYQFYECLRKFEYTNLDLNQECKALEIGTGYSIISPVILFLLGFDKIVTVDIDKDVSFRTFRKQIIFLCSENFIKQIMDRGIYQEKVIKEKLDKIVTLKNIEEVLEFCNITYKSSYTLDDIENEGIIFEYIYSQVVFEHIPPTFLIALFKKLKTWLKQDCFTVHTVNFIDHYANPGIFEDKKISEFNFLRFSDSYWNFWSGNSIAYTNRLSYIYYLDLFKENKMEVIHFIGENYRPQKILDHKQIHKDIIKKYNSKPDLLELTKYQRGTFIVKNS
ncbi:hypothetical protein [Aquimarina sp. RZ0]|uniref:hypothetical protein n=1 Tax=Aquimarina sp. RZ0 TaxID=2607730 RepID=UPI0011F3D570|nr:hypothetical protein [Aquimarina sp. RZ0]KAA1244904.1 hypothetical protein F0000_14275 [Aquimarina sp. RZ0]